VHTLLIALLSVYQSGFHVLKRINNYVYFVLCRFTTLFISCFQFAWILQVSTTCTITLHWCDHNGKYKPTLRPFEKCVHRPVATKEPLGIKECFIVHRCRKAVSVQCKVQSCDEYIV